MSLAIYLAAIAAFVVLLSLISAVSFQHSFFASAVQQQLAARNLAEAALQQTLVTVLRSPNQGWGCSKLSSEVIRVTSSVYPNAEGFVSFNPTAARDHKVPVSLNNLRGGSVVPGSLGRQLPMNTVQVIARGVSGESVKTLEMLFYVPPFPNALASEGPIRSRGGLLVGGLMDPSKFTGDFNDLAPEDQMPAHVVSNNNSAEAVRLGPGARILGNVGAVGGVVLDPDVVVSGAVREHIEPQAIPKFDLPALFSRVGSQIGSDLLAADIPALNLAWNAHTNGNLIIHGDLNMDGGVLVVSGDLTVQGGVYGKGAIFVNGQTLVVGGASFHSSDQVALVSTKRITLNGGGKQSSFFQGLMYSDQDIVASDVTVLGAVIARGLGGLELNDVNMINSPVTLHLVDGVELQNFSDDDTVQILIRVQKRDPQTHQPLSYKVQVRGRSNDPKSPPVPVEYSRFGENVSQEAEGDNLKDYGEIRAFISNHLNVGVGYAQNSYQADWLWNNQGGTSFPDNAPDPLREYLDRLDGKKSDSSRLYTINLNPNEALGILERARILLWREVANN